MNDDVGKSGETLERGKEENRADVVIELAQNGIAVCLC